MSAERISIEHLTAEVKRLRIEDGDVVVIRCTEAISQETAERIRQSVESVMQKAGRSPPIMILDKAMSIEILAASKLKRMSLDALVERDYD